MNVLIVIGFILLSVIIVAPIYAACVVAGNSDKQAQQEFENYIREKNQTKIISTLQSALL